ncbi:hypothetical protein R5R35_007822 [Gryllus longicercus]|uniref:CRAL-TRIO domain-containing protein n=1 Tax=Gryllus longicercus TaxID=2509291 RepID=A0AAN9VZA7_9ORTH
MAPEEGPHLAGAVGPCVGLAPLPLPAAWAERARREVHEQPAAAARNVAALRQRLLEERNLHARTDDTFLLAFLRARKHNVEEALKVLKNFYRLKIKYPLYTEDCLPSEKPFVYDMNGYTILEERDQLDRTIIAMRVEHFFQQLWTAHQLVVQDPLVQVAGVVLIVDMRGFSLRHARIVTPSFARIAMRFVQDSFPVRTQAIHIVFEPFYFDAIFMLFKPFLKAKLRDRIHLHGADLDSLRAMVPERALPEELGGCAPGWNFAGYRSGVARNEHLFRAWRHYGYGKGKEEPGTSAP